MAEKASVYVIVPECNEKFNFLVPQKMKISSMHKLIVDILSKENRLSEKQKRGYLLNLATGKILCDDDRVENSGIFDGTELLMIVR